MTLEDQQQINTFARRNTRLEELKEQIGIKKVRCYFRIHALVFES